MNCNKPYDDCIRSSGCMWYNFGLDGIQPSDPQMPPSSPYVNMPKCVSKLDVTSLNDLSFTAIQMPITDNNTIDVYINTIYHGKTPIIYFPIIKEIKIVISYNNGSETPEDQVTRIPTPTSTTEPEDPKKFNYNPFALNNTPNHGIGVPKSLQKLLSPSMATYSPVTCALDQLITFKIPTTHSGYNDFTSRGSIIPALLTFDLTNLYACIDGQDTADGVLKNIFVKSIQFIGADNNRTAPILVSLSTSNIINPEQVKQEITSKLQALMPNINMTGRNIQTILSLVKRS